MRFNFSYIYLIQLEVQKGENQLKVAKKLLKLLNNTYGIQHNTLISIVYKYISEYYKNSNQMSEYYEYIEKSIFFDSDDLN